MVCTECSKNNLSLPDKGFTKPVRVCTVCYEKIVGFPSARRGQLLSQSHGMPRIMYASTSRHGLREDNEDRICVDIKWNQDDQDDMNPRFMAFFGVFDGHSGSDTSQHLKEQLPTGILTRLRHGHLTRNEISHLRTMSRSSRRSSRTKPEPSFTQTTELEAEEKKVSPVAETPQLATMFDDPEPSISRMESINEEVKTSEEAAAEQATRNSDSSRPAESEMDPGEGDDLVKIVQYSCMRTDFLYQQNQLRKPNSERSHSGSCAVFVVFTNAKLRPANNSRFKDALRWLRRSSNSEAEKSVSRHERERSVSRSIFALSPRTSPKQSVAGEWNGNMPPEQLLTSPSTGGVIPWIFARKSKSRPPPSPDVQSDLSVVCASVGDSEIVLHEKGQTPVSLFKKHNWDDPEEEQRVKERGGDIREQHGVKRICVPGTLRPTLAVSRSFGDVAFKRGARITKKKTQLFSRAEGAVLKEDLVTCAPAVKDVSNMVLAGGVNLLVLASDGLWDMFKHEEAIQFIQDELNEHFKKREAKKSSHSAKRRASAQDFSPTRGEELPEGNTALLSAASAPPVSASSTPTSASTFETPPREPPPPPTLNGTTQSTSSTSPTTSTTTTNTAQPARGGRAASVQAASTIVIHRPPRRQSFSSGVGVPSSSPRTSLPPPSASFPSISPPTSPTNQSSQSGLSVVSTYPSNPSPPAPHRLPSPPPPPATNSVAAPPPPPPSPTKRESSGLPPPPPPVAAAQAPSTPAPPPLSTDSPTKAVHVTFASSPQIIFPSPMQPPDTPPSSFNSALAGLVSPTGPDSLLSPYRIASPSQSEQHSAESLIPDLASPDDRTSGEFPPLVTIVSPDPNESKSEVNVSRVAWTAPAPSKHSSRRDQQSASVDDSKVQYSGGLDAEELEDWAALQRICDKLADAAVQRMALQPHLEGDNVSVVIIYFPS